MQLGIPLPWCLRPYRFLAGGQMSEEVILLIDSLTDFTEQARLSGEGVKGALQANIWSVLLLLGLAGGVAHDGLAQRNHFLVAFSLFSPPLVLPIFPSAYAQSRPLLILHLQLPAQQFDNLIHSLFGQTHLRHCLYDFSCFFHFCLHLAEMLPLHLPNFFFMLDLHLADFSVLLGAGFEVEGGKCGNLMIMIARSLCCLPLKHIIFGFQFPNSLRCIGNLLFSLLDATVFNLFVPFCI